MDDESLTSDIDHYFTPKYALFSKKDKTITLFGGNVAAYKYSKAVFAQYEIEGEIKDVVTTVFTSEDKRLRISIFDYEGNQLMQKDVTVDSLYSTSKYNFKYDDNKGYLLEIFSGGVISIDKKLSSPSYLYDNAYTGMELIKDDYVILTYKINNVTKGIAKYETDLKTLVWSYEIDIKDKNHGFETLIYDDFNMDGVVDVIGVVISYNDKDEPKYSNYITLMEPTEKF